MIHCQFYWKKKEVLVNSILLQNKKIILKKKISKGQMGKFCIHSTTVNISAVLDVQQRL